eukprot:gene8222-9069_t
MFRAVATRSVRAVQVCSKPSFAQTRAFSGILSDREQQGGRRKEEVDAEVAGKVAFNRDPIIPDENAGTKENPILVPSGFQTRPVGYEDPVTHAITWFNLTAGKLHYVPDLNLYFKLSPVA